MTVAELVSFPFMQQALVTGCAVAVVCAVLSCFIVLRSWALLGDALSHAVLPGVVLAYIAGWPLSVGAFLAGLGCAGATGFVRQNSRIREETALGVVFTGLFAFGMVLHTKTESELHLDHILFGNLLGLEPSVRLQTWVGAAVITFILLVWRRDLLLVCFDRSHGRVLGLPVRWLEYLLLVLVVGAVVTAIQAAGVLPVVAMLITPGATARLCSARFDRMLGIAVVLAVASTVLGVLASARWEASTAGCVVLVQSGLFLLAFLFAPSHGWCWRMRPAAATMSSSSGM